MLTLTVIYVLAEFEDNNDDDDNNDNTDLMMMKWTSPIQISLLHVSYCQSHLSRRKHAKTETSEMMRNLNKDYRKLLNLSNYVCEHVFWAVHRINYMLFLLQCNRLFVINNILLRG